MAKLPEPKILLAGFLAHLALSKIIYRTSLYDLSSIYAAEICRKPGILWILLILCPALIGLITAIKNKEARFTKGLIAIVTLFLLCFSGDHLGDWAFFCSTYSSTVYNSTGANPNYYMYSYCTIPIMAIASLLITVHFLLKATPPTSTGSSNILPDPEIILLGVCIQFTVGKCIYVAEVRWDLCWGQGMGAWLEILAGSANLNFLTIMKTENKYRAPRSLSTFFGSFIISVTANYMAVWAISCAMYFTNSAYAIYDYVTLVINGILALVLLIIYLKKNPADAPQNTNPTAQNAQVIVAPHTQSYPMNVSYPPPAAYPPQQTYPGLPPSHYPPASYPPQSYPLQASYPAQPSYPPQASYPSPPSYPGPPQASYPSQVSQPPGQYKDPPPAYEQ